MIHAFERNRPRHGERGKCERKNFAAQQRRAADAIKPSSAEQRGGSGEQRAGEPPKRIVPAERFTEQKHEQRCGGHAAPNGSARARFHRAAAPTPCHPAKKKRHAEAVAILLVGMPFAREVQPRPEPRDCGGGEPRAAIEAGAHGVRFWAAATIEFSSGKSLSFPLTAFSKNGAAFAGSPAA